MSVGGGVGDLTNRALEAFGARTVDVERRDQVWTIWVCRKHPTLRSGPHCPNADCDEADLEEIKVVRKEEGKP